MLPWVEKHADLVPPQSSRVYVRLLLLELLETAVVVLDLQLLDEKHSGTDAKVKQK